MKLKFVILILSSLFLFACDSETANNSANVNKNANQKVNTNVAIDSSVPLILSGTGVTENYNCGGREVEIEAETTASRYVLKGECKKLTIDGVSNQIQVEKVGEIVINGTSNKLVYAEGLNNKKPKIKKTGADNLVESKEESEKRLKAEEKKAVTKPAGK